MKIENTTNTIERSASFQEESFSIGDEAFMMEVLRSKLYPVPIKTIVQEISCNARDAHREMGKEKIPIEIKLPSKLEPSLKIRDYGPGMDPNRIKDIFVKFGKSTKRSDNTQTGGFGIGAKSPWAYVDSFNIWTITPHDGSLIKRCYVAYLDESRKGKLALVFEKPTDEPQGTCFEIPCNPKDVDEFLRWTKHIFRFWSVKPVVTPTIKWADNTPVLEGNGWSIASVGSIEKQLGNPTVLVDEIPYPLEIGKVPVNTLDHRQRSLLSATTCFAFKTGDVSVAANRDDLEYNKQTIDTIITRIKETIGDLQKIFAQKISSSTCLMEAICLSGELMRQYPQITPSMQWRGKNIPNVSISIPSNVFSVRTFEKGTLRNRRAYSIFVDRKSKIMYDDDDTAGTSRGRVADAFDKNTNVNTIYVVKPKIGVPKDVMDQAMDGLEKACRWSELQIENITKYDKKRSVPASRNYAAQCRLWKVDGASQKTSVDHTTVTSGLLMIRYEDQYMGRDGYKFEEFEVAEISKKMGPLFAVPKRFKDDVNPGLVWVDDAIAKIKNSLLKDQVLVDNIHDIASANLSAWCVLPSVKDIDIEKITNKNSVAYLYLKRSKELMTLADMFKNRVPAIKLLSAAELMKEDCVVKSATPIKQLHSEFIKMYPLLGYIPFVKSIEKEIIHYLNSKASEKDAKL